MTNPSLFQFEATFNEHGYYMVDVFLERDKMYRFVGILPHDIEQYFLKNGSCVLT